MLRGARGSVVRGTAGILGWLTGFVLILLAWTVAWTPTAVLAMKIDVCWRLMTEKTYHDLFAIPESQWSVFIVLWIVIQVCFGSIAGFFGAFEFAGYAQEAAFRKFWQALRAKFAAAALATSVATAGAVGIAFLVRALGDVTASSKFMTHFAWMPLIGLQWYFYTLAISRHEELKHRPKTKKPKTRSRLDDWDRKAIEEEIERLTRGG
jgi:hypothetical protein